MRQRLYKILKVQSYFYYFGIVSNYVFEGVMEKVKTQWGSFRDGVKGNDLAIGCDQKAETPTLGENIKNLTFLTFRFCSSLSTK